MAREDDFTATVDGAAAHAAALDEWDWDWDRPTERELRAEDAPRRAFSGAVIDDPWAVTIIGPLPAPPF